MIKLFSTAAAVALVVGTGLAFAAEPASMAPMAKDGLYVTTKGMTLYTFDKDSAGKSVCNGPCAVNWPPALVADDAKASGAWSIVTRDDGLKQWAYKSKPLYYWTKDQKPGERGGDGVNGVWRAAQP